MGEKGEDQRKRQDWWLRLSFCCKRPAGWGANEVGIRAAGRQQETSQTDWTEPRFRGQMGLFGESCRSRSRVGQWLLPVR